MKMPVYEREDGYYNEHGVWVENLPDVEDPDVDTKGPPNPDPTDDPCYNGDHEWIEAFDGNCMYCRYCGIYDC